MISQWLSLIRSYLPSTAEGWTAAATVAIAIFNAILGFFTVSLAGSTRRAANAAIASAEAAIATETARFHIVIEDTNFDFLIRRNNEPVFKEAQDGQPLESPLQIIYRFRNYGKTPGVIKDISVNSMIASDPMDAVYQLLIDAIREPMVAGGGETPKRVYQTGYNALVGQIRAIERNDARIWFFGRLDYVDVFGKPHTHRFYFRTVTHEGRCFLQSFDYKHYNQST